MKKIFFLLTCCLFFTNAKADYINYYLMHTGIDATLKEEKRQNKIKQNEALVMASEEVNEERGKKLKEKYKKIKDRLNNLSLIIDAFFLAPNAIPAVKGTIQNQKRIYQECKDMPELVPIAVESEVQFAKQVEMLIRFITGLTLSYGDINQMKTGDRKILLNHAIEEIDGLWTTSSKLLNTIDNLKMAKMLRELEFKGWVNREKDMIKEIINNAKTF